MDTNNNQCANEMAKFQSSFSMRHNTNVEKQFEYMTLK